jgi:hypothetical protein
MTEPKRWSSPGSEIDPVLRSVMIHARDQRPSSDQLQAILRGAGRPRAVPKRRAAPLLSGVALGLALAGVSFAASSWLERKATTEVVVQPPPPSARPLPRAFGPGATPSAAALPAPAPPAPKPSSPSKRASSATPPATVTPPPSPEQDAALLQDARRALLDSPARALLLSEEHARSFPQSALTEERQALHVEALARLGRSAAARTELELFEARFPRSIYRRRLQALLPP